MCSPSLAIAGASVAGAGISAAGQYQASKFNAQMAERQAALQEKAAQDVIERGDEQADRQREQTGRLIGEQRATIGASGVEMDSGSPLRLQTDSRYQGELDALTIEENARREAMGLSRGAQQSRMESEFTRRRGQIGAGSTLLTGGAQAGSNYMQLNALGG